MNFSKALKSTPEEPKYPPLWNGPPRMEPPQPELVDDGVHPLLEPQPTPGYSSSVIQRAYITWMQLGKKINFRVTCDYYHRLDQLEETLSEEARTESRRLEYSLLNQPMPMTAEFVRNYGHIYGFRAPQGSPDSGNGSSDPRGMW